MEIDLQKKLCSKKNWTLNTYFDPEPKTREKKRKNTVVQTPNRMCHIEDYIIVVRNEDN